MFVKIKILALAVAALLATYSTSGAEKTISVLTCGAGGELYSVFGHSALMVTDNDTGDSVIYNFGMFDFETPFFYYKFVRGDLDYYLGTESANWFMYAYTEEERTVVSQKLYLTDAETKRIINELDTLMLPENRAYKYKFIKDNCTTALRDLILNNVDYDKSMNNAHTGITYREYLNDCLYSMPWTKLGINFIMGSRTDREADFYGSLFLPYIFMEGLAQITTPEGMLAAPVQKLNNPPEAPAKNPQSGYYIMYVIFGALAGFAIFNRSRIAAAVFFYLLGALGFLLIFTTSVSLHEELTRNFNILWCNPLFIIAAVATSMPTRQGKKRFILFAASSGLILLCMVAMIIVWATGIQAFDLIFAIISLTAICFMHRTAHTLYASSGLRR